MNCLGWNCRGLGSPRTVRVLCDLVKDRSPDVLFLSETISVASKVESLRIILGFSQCFSVDRVGNGGELAVFWKNSARCQIASFLRTMSILSF